MATIVEIVRAISPVINDALMIEQERHAFASQRSFLLHQRDFRKLGSFTTPGREHYCDSAKIVVIRDTGPLFTWMS